MLAYEEATEAVVQPVLKKGDVVFFTEAATHGTLPWRSDTERRTVLYRFAPSGSAYGRNYLDGLAELDGLTEAEAAVLQPLFHTRLDRPDPERGWHPFRRPRHASSTRRISTKGVWQGLF